jgi:hypothetical protein
MAAANNWQLKYFPALPAGTSREVPLALETIAAEVGTDG